MHITPFLANYPELNRIPSPEIFCAEAKNAFLDYLQNGWMIKTGQKALYVYQIEDGHHRRHTGLVALNEVRDFFAGNVKKHEKTLSERENIHKDLFLRWGAMLKPVLLTYPPVPEIRDWLLAFAQNAAPFFEVYFANDGQTHRIWMATEAADIHYLQTLFARHVTSVYIADGHHRTTTLALLNRQFKQAHPKLDFDHLFCAFFSTDQLDIQDYNRVVEGLNGMTPTEFLAQLSEIADLEPVENPRKPRKKHELKVFLEEHWYRLHWKKETLSAAEAAPGGAAQSAVLLDVNLLNEYVLHRLLGIHDVRNDARIMYVEGSKGLKGIRKIARNSRDRVGFALHPVAFSDMMRMADAGESLPPKSTYFEPRLKSGIIVRMLADK